VRLIGLWCGMPFGSTEVFEQVDVVVTCVPELRDRLRSLGCNARHVHHAFDSRVLTHLDGGREQNIQLSFIGQLIRAGGFHGERVRQLERIVDELEIDIFSPAQDVYLRPPQRRPGRGAVYRLARLLSDRHPAQPIVHRVPPSRKAVYRAESFAPPASQKLRPYTHPPVFGLAMYETLRRSRITFNSHVDVSTDSASNRRLFEATGVGTCLLTDHKPNIATLFEPDREVVTFAGIDDCVDKVRWLLDHPTERDEIARSGQRRALADHTYAERAGELDSVIRAELAATTHTRAR
jgi:spore maturation protein CgeB